MRRYGITSKGINLFLSIYPEKLHFHGVLGSKSRRSKMGKVYNVKRQVWYLSGYLSKADFERYHFNGGWVFPGWIGFSQWIKKEFGDYPPREMLVELGRMGQGERKEHTWFGLYLWDKKHSKGGN